jgi:HSP20 family protein
MALKDLVPWHKRRPEEEEGERLPARYSPVEMFREVMEDFFRPAHYPRWRHPEWWGEPAVDVSETDEDYKVTVELPGMDKEDIDVTLEEGRLTIRGEKQQEQKEEKEGYLWQERSYGSFTRTVPLPSTVKEEEIEATFKNGVLSLRLPKTEEARGKKLEIKGE